MSRGVRSEHGATRVSSNGYHYVKTERGWVLYHHLIAEQRLGRPLQKGERVYFKDGDRNNLTADNVVVRKVKVDKEERIKKLRYEIEVRLEELKQLEDDS